ncbi:hypothetical protein BON30_42755 [Cystobacter ferrugineus]|uniref:HTH lysR-type domain-containing protein n=1 Tax=Cystobacter ferrugineus TaxID=83449 RepID=A0A1L9AWZ2_9BACT|nr:hypothetical protein BON30_42755 [Cystobacter ferrugineus]
MTPSAVSKQVAHLEERLGTRLLRRTTRHLSLTEAGSIFYQHCQRVLGELEEARLAMAALDERPRGTLRVSVPTVLGEVHIGSAAAAFQESIANLPRYLVLEELRSGALVSLLAEHPVTQRHIYLVYPHRQLTPPKVRAFADFLARYFQRILGQAWARP